MASGARGASPADMLSSLLRSAAHLNAFVLWSSCWLWVSCCSSSASAFVVAEESGGDGDERRFLQAQEIRGTRL